MPAQKVSPAVLAKRYAIALLESAESKADRKAISNDIQALKALADDSDFSKVAANPMVPVEGLKSVAAAIADKAGLSKMVAGFLRVLAENRRLGILPDVIEAFERLLRVEEGELVARVTTAQKPSAATKKALTEALEKATGKKVLIEANENKDILGGVVIRLDGVTIDGSLSGKLSRLKQQLKQPLTA